MRCTAAVLAAVVTFQASPCAARQPAAEAAAAAAPNADPFEPMNRRLYALNGFVDRILFRPAAVGYRRLLPRPIRRAVHNVIGNLGEPVVFANDLLQFRLRRAAGTAARFAGNTTLGVLGVFDVATSAGLPHHDNSFGVTLGRAGVGPGPFLFLPGLGPTTLRDLVGDGVDLYIDPINQIPNSNSRTLVVTEVVVGAVDARAEADSDLKDLEAAAADPYATRRSVYLQQMKAKISGEEVPLDLLPDIPSDPEPAQPPAPPPPTAPAADPSPDSAGAPGHGR